MPEVLINVGPGGVMEAGLASARHPESVQFWHDGENVAFRNLGVEKALGAEEPLRLSSAPVIRLAQAHVGGLRRVYFQDSFFRVFASDEGGPAYFLGQLSGPAELEPYGAHLLAAQNGLWLWPGSGVLGQISAAGAAKLISKCYQHVLLSDGTDLYWPDVRDVSDFTPGPEKTARRLRFRDLESPILTLAPIGQKSLGVYTRDNLRLVNYVGTPIWFGHAEKDTLDGIGGLGPSSVISAGFKNYGLTRNNIFVTDGSQFQYIDTPPMHGFLEANMNWNLAHTVFGFHNEGFQEVVWFYPHLTGTIQGIGFKYTNGAFTKYNLNVRAALDREVFDYPLFGTNEGVFYGKGRTSRSCVLRTRPLDAGDSMITKLFQHYRFVGTFSDAKVRLGVADEVNASPFYFYEGDLETVIFAEQEGVFLTIELSSTSGFFEISQVLVSGQPGGPLI